ARNDVNNMSAEKKFLNKSMTDMYDMFLLNLSLLIEVKNQAVDFIERSRSKYLPTAEDINPNLNFVNNKVLKQIENSEEFNDLLEKKKLHNWFREPGYVQMIWNDLRKSEVYKNYTSKTEASFSEDKKFLIDFFKEFIAPNQKIHEYYEDHKLTWMDDLPIVNTAIVRTLERFKKKAAFRLPRLFKNEEDREFAFSLFQRTLMYEADFKQDIEKKTLKDRKSVV